MTCEVIIGKYCLEYILVLQGLDSRLLWIFCTALAYFLVKAHRRINDLEKLKGGR